MPRILENSGVKPILSFGSPQIEKYIAIPDAFIHKALQDREGLGSSEEIHGLLAKACLFTMNNTPRVNILDFTNPLMLSSKIPDVQQRITASVPPSL